MTGWADAWRRCAIPLFALALLWPALLNGSVPLVFPDTMDYLVSGRDLLLGWTRPPGYAFAILPLWRPLGLPWGLWPVVVAQALLSAWLVWLTLDLALDRRAGLAARWLLAALPLLAGATSLPFFTSWVMADALSAPTLLAAALLAAGWAALRRAERAGLLALVLLGAASHQTHTVMAAAAGLAVLAGGFRQRPRPAWRSLGRGPVAVLAMAVLALASVLALNRVVHGEADTAQAAPSFLFARLVGDGLVQPHMAELCVGREAAPLCRRRDWLVGQPVDEVLWHPWSPLWADYHGFEYMRADAQALVWGTLRLEWPAALRNGLWRAARLLVKLDFPELDLRPMERPMMGGLNLGLPQLAAPVAASRQMTGAFRDWWPARLAPWAMLAGLGGLLLAVPVLLFRRAATGPPAGLPLGLVGAAVLAGMLANALVVGLTAEAYDRYQARLGWLPLLVLLAAAARAWQHRRVRGGGEAALLGATV